MPPAPVLMDVIFLQGLNMIRLLFIALLGMLHLPVQAETIYVSPDSELGQMMLQLDAMGRFAQNTPRMNAELNEFDEECGMIEALSLYEPGEKLSKKVYNYVITASTELCGEQQYMAKIKFKDAARTIMKKVKIINRIKV